MGMLKCDRSLPDVEEARCDLRVGWQHNFLVDQEHEPTLQPFLFVGDHDNQCVSMPEGDKKANQSCQRGDDNLCDERHLLAWDESDEGDEREGKNEDEEERREAIS